MISFVEYSNGITIVVHFETSSFNSASIFATNSPLSEADALPIIARSTSFRTPPFVTFPAIVILLGISFETKVPFHKHAIIRETSLSTAVLLYLRVKASGFFANSAPPYVPPSPFATLAAESIFEEAKTQGLPMEIKPGATDPKLELIPTNLFFRTTYFDFFSTSCVTSVSTLTIPNWFTLLPFHSDGSTPGRT